MADSPPSPPRRGKVRQHGAGGDQLAPASTSDRSPVPNASSIPPVSHPLLPAPSLFHRVKRDRSILALVVSEECIFAGTQGGEILVWSLGTYQLRATVYGHRGSVLCLFLSQDRSLLFSSAGDAIVNVWCPKALHRLYSIYSTFDVGDVFCVAYSSTVRTAYFGAQNTSIQWYDLSQKDSRPPPNPIYHPSHRNHRFFDSVGPGGLSTPRPITTGDASPRAQGGQDLEIDKGDILQYAHYGYVYCMLLAQGLGKQGSDEETLISGGGDGTIKLWSLHPDHGAISEAHVLENGDNSVLSLALDGTILYSGLLGGEINVWDLDTKQLVRSVRAHAEDVLTLSVGGGHIFSGGASGLAKKFNHKYECTGRWEAHKGLILASALTVHHGRHIYVTGGNDDCVAVWDVSGSASERAGGSKTSNEQLHESLARFIKFRTVSSDLQYAEDCRRGATYLRTLFKRFGAATEMLTTESNLNPIVFAKFKGNPGSPVPRKKILFYGHYDVIAAENEQGKWKSDPFTMEPINGYVYGRGASDNKGPVLAALYAAAELLREQVLDSDLIFLIEGEEESGSRGFEDSIKRNKHIIGDVDYIILANSYWLDDEMPCLTYGLRGVIHATVSVESPHPDLHSGVDGSALMDESLKDLVMLLATLGGRHGRVNIPGFYDSVLKVTDAEQKRYADIVTRLLRRNPDLADRETLTKSLLHRWQEATLSIHRFKVSGPENATIIPCLARAALSIRLVPNQETEKIKNALIKFLRERFEELDTKNRLTIAIDHEAEPWLGDPENEIFKTLEDAIVQVWGPFGEVRRRSTASSDAPLDSSPSKPVPATSSILSQGHDYISHPNRRPSKSDETAEEPPTGPLRKPLYIREGGSIPSIRFLEKEFDAPAAHLPCGQASDSAHLDNERIRLTNLYNSREIFKRVFRELPRK